MFSSGVGRDQKQSLKESECWTYSHHVAKNATPTLMIMLLQIGSMCKYSLLPCSQKWINTDLK